MSSDLFFGKWCSECDEEKTNFNWCSTCNAKRFRQNFENWTSGNDNINKFIRDAQLSADDYFKVLEWIPFDRFYDVEFIASGGFGSVYKARWIDGSIRNWDDKNQVWERLRQNDFVALKSLNDSSNVSLEFIREITCHKNLDISASIIKLYGITQEPKTKNYMMVMEFAENGSLRNYLNKNNNLSWKDKIRNMHYIALGLTKIHEKGLIHRDLHSGNIVMHNDQTCITDMGLCRPVSDNTESVYGVIPYIAPETLRDRNYTKAADIYSFGIIMYEIISGLRPHFDRNYDVALIQEIWKGLRPKFNIKVPQLILDLINKCLDGNPSKRPTADEIVNRLHKWLEEINNNQNNQMNQSELILQIKEADKFNKINSSTRSKPLNSKLFSDAAYRSSKVIHSSVINRTNNNNMNASYQVSQVNFSDLEISNSYGSESCQVTQVNS